MPSIDGPHQRLGSRAMVGNAGPKQLDARVLAEVKEVHARASAELAFQVCPTKDIDPVAGFCCVKTVSWWPPRSERIQIDNPGRSGQHLERSP
jgi:hypothetical protein